MVHVGLWNVTDSGPQRLMSADIVWERQLEDWIEQDPSLPEAGLTIVGRQVYVEGGPLDLLAVDSQGRWVVIELKRDRLYRETFAQALDYAASIASMPSDQLLMRVSDYLAKKPGDSLSSVQPIIQEAATDPDQEQPFRDVRVYLVGTSLDPGLLRLTTYLANAHNVPTTVVTYQVFEVGSGQRVLLRELTEAETHLSSGEETPHLTVEDVCKRADAEGIGETFRRILKSASDHGLYPRPFKSSIMFTPPSNRTRTLFTIWARPERPDVLRMWVGPEGFAEFYPISQSDAEACLGESGWQMIAVDQVDGFIQSLDQLFGHIDAARQ